MHTAKYYYDPAAQLLHTFDCACLESGEALSGFNSIKACIKKRFKPCPVCCGAEYRRQSAEVTADYISRSYFNFVYSIESEVFHTSECFHARRIPYWKMKGSLYFENSASADRRPCRFCKPTEEYRRFIPKGMKKKAGTKLLHGMTRQLSESEKRAYDRHVQASKEREAQASTNYDRDFLTRTSSAYAFWAGKGYSTFHLQHCPKMKGLTELRGYAKYNHATSKGLKPCRYCNPSRKHDLEITIPSGSSIRQDESLYQLDQLCKKHAYDHKVCDTLYYINTPVGKWRLHTEKRPVELWHINLVNCKGKPDEYHRQPRLLLSLTDTFHYIHNHDKSLLKEKERHEHQGNW